MCVGVSLSLPDVCAGIHATSALWNSSRPNVNVNVNQWGGVIPIDVNLGSVTGQHQVIVALLYKVLGRHEGGQGSNGEPSESRRAWDAGVLHGVCLAGAAVRRDITGKKTPLLLLLLYQVYITK